jgi:predicted ester cyclase
VSKREKGLRMTKQLGNKADASMAHEFARMLNEKDVDNLDGLLAEGYANHNRYVEDGLEANKRFWSYWLSAFPDTEVTVEDAFASEAGDRVVGRFAYRATHTGEFMGAAPTGRRVEMTSIDVWRVEDGRFAEHWDEINGLEFFGQLGLVPMAQEGEGRV